MPFDPPFSGYIQPPGVPPDPTGDCWRGPPGPVGPPGNMAASSKLFYAVGGVAKWSVDASGNMRCAGTVTGSVTP